MEFSGLICGEHDADCSLYCKSCDSLVCPTCVSKTHRKHELIEIPESYDMKVGMLRREQEVLSGTKEDILSKIKRLNTSKLEKESSIKEKEQEIENHGIALKQMIDVNVAMLKTELQESRKSIMKNFDDDLKSLEITKEKTENKCKEIEESIETIDVVKLFTNTEILLSIPPTASEGLSVPRFMPSNLQINGIGELVGGEDPAELPNINLDIKGLFSTNLSSIWNVLSCSDGSLWLSDDVKLQHVQIKEDNLKVLYTTKLCNEISSLTKTPENTILLCIKGESKVQRMDPCTYQMADTAYDVSPLHTASVHVTSQGEVVIGAGNDEEGRVEIIVMDSKGRQLRVYDHYDKQQTFSCPMSITSTSNGNIHVSDIFFSENDCGSRVVVLGPNGDTINVYTGHPGVNKDVPFRSISIVTNSKDNVIVADAYTHHLHLLNSEGELLTVFNTREVGIELPFSLAITQDHSLWIGCMNHSETQETRLYQVNFNKSLT